MFETGSECPLAAVMSIYQFLPRPPQDASSAISQSYGDSGIVCLDLARRSGRNAFKCNTLGLGFMRQPGGMFPQPGRNSQIIETVLPAIVFQMTWFCWAVVLGKDRVLKGSFQTALRMPQDAPECPLKADRDFGRGSLHRNLLWAFSVIILLSPRPATIQAERLICFIVVADDV